MFDGESFGKEIVSVVKGFLERSLAPITSRLDALEKRISEKSVSESGVGIAGALIDRAGNLVITLSNGEVKSLGIVVGRDGETIKGADGLGFDDLSEELADDGRTIIRRYVRGDEVKEFRHTFPVVLDRGVYKSAQEYTTGDGVTWAGSFWIAQKDTSEKPGSGDDWRLAVKSGRAGRDGRDLTERTAPVKLHGDSNE